MRGELLTRQPPTPLTSPTEFLSSHEDGEGNVWLGTHRNGLFRVRKQVVTAYSKADGLLENNVYPIFEDRRGVVWIGTTGGLFKRENETFALVKSAENFHVSAIGEDAAGRILITDGGTLYVQENDEFVPFEPDKILDVGFINAIHADLENALWIGGGNGLRRFKDGVLTNFTTADGLAGNDVKVIIEARAGGLWIGTYGGLTRFENGRLTSWREADGLPSRTVRALYEDAEGTLWIGSYDGGLARFKDGKFTRYDTKTGLPNDGAFQILEDDSRNFWISSNRGIYRVSRDELNDFADGKRNSITSITYDKSDGMLNAECNGGRSPAGIRASDGRLWFPTQDGVAVIDPREIKINSQPPPVVIETVKIDNTDLEFNDEKSKIQVEPQQQNFEIIYTALSFINSENLRFKYKLEGLDDEWIDAGTRRLAYFSHVPPGDYTFRVIAANSDNVWNEQGATLKIIVLPPFYRTWWFISLAVLLLTFTVFALVKRRVSQLAKDRAAQQAFSRQLIASQEQERKRIAAELHDSLGQRLVVIKNLSLMFLNAKNGKAADNNQIEEISAEASQAIGEVKEISYNLRPYQLDRIGLTKAVEAVVRSAQSASTIEFTAEIDDIDDYFPKDAEINFYRIVQECVNNLVKHSWATTAFVKIELSGENLNLVISDNGKGFTPNQIESKTGGFGLVGINERVELFGGKVEIKSAPKQGAEIRIQMNSRNFVKNS
jgi:signal transduction histidine kinase